MKRLPLLLTAALLLCLGTVRAAQTVKKLNLKVLYVGGATDRDYFAFSKDTTGQEREVAHRTAAWGEMLSHYFTTVKTMPAKDYTQECSRGYDVTIMDGTPAKTIRPRVVDRAKQYYGHAAYLSEDFDLPMVTIGSAGETIGRSIGSKNDWYCLCLDADAHSWVKNHPIFKGPFKVNMTVKVKPTPEDAKHYAYFTGPVPDSIPMWAVQTKGYKTDPDFCVGMVSRPWGYTDSPEAEYISSGVCAKTLDAVAIGRHGNFLHWGFAASPEYMTEEAKTVFANAVVYISKFKRQGLIARKYDENQTTLDYLKELEYLSTEEAYTEHLQMMKEWNAEMLTEKAKAQEKKAKGEQLSERDEQVIDFEPQPDPTREEYVKRYIGDWFTRFGTDSKAFCKYLEDNKPYLYGGDGFYEVKVDEDCKRLGIGNHDIRLLETAITMLENKQDEATARRLLTRYTLCSFRTATEWRAWFEKYKTKLFFCESADWVWLVNTRETGVNDYQGWMKRKTLDKVEAGETSGTNPVAVTAAREYADNGDQLLILKFKIHPGFHIYAYVPDTESFIETAVNFQLPEGYTADGKMQKPQGQYFTGQVTIYEDEATFVQRIKGTSTQPIMCTVKYQCCDSKACLPPVEQTIEVK